MTSILCVASGASFGHATLGVTIIQARRGLSKLSMAIDNVRVLAIENVRVFGLARVGSGATEAGQTENPATLMTRFHRG